MEATETKPGLRGKELLRAAVNQIIKHPETWDQHRWHCGTSHCIGGWCQILAGNAAIPDRASADAREALGITVAQAVWLFDYARSLNEIYSFATKFITGKDYCPQKPPLL